MCRGQLLPVNQNQALFALLGTTYGGNGQTTFALPDLQGRTPLHFGTDQSGQSYPIGMPAGSESVTLIITNLPAHSHPMNAVANSDGNSANAGNSVPARVGAVSPNPSVNIYVSPSAGGVVPLASDTITGGGSGGAHPNMQPFQVTNYCIALMGIFPPRN